MKLSTAWISLSLVGTAQAFAPATGRLGGHTTALHALPPVVEHWNDAVVAWDHLHQSLLLADETAVATAKEATGWWGAYINIFKSTLYGLHGAIDAPLRSIGFDQTWGVSIALFTGCT